jgi:hypothetical protein
MRLQPESFEASYIMSRKRPRRKKLRRDTSEVDFKSDIDEFIHLAQRWNTLHKRLLNTLARLPEEIYQFTLQKILFPRRPKPNHTSRRNK